MMLESSVGRHAAGLFRWRRGCLARQHLGGGLKLAKIKTTTLYSNSICYTEILLSMELV